MENRNLPEANRHRLQLLKDVSSIRAQCL